MLTTSTTQLTRHFTPPMEADYIDELHKESAEKLRKSLTRVEQNIEQKLRNAISFKVNTLL